MSTYPRGYGSYAEYRRWKQHVHRGSDPLRDTAALVAALGGDSAVAALYDVRLGVTLNGSTVSQWDDARGASGFGPSFVQATSANQPAWTGGGDDDKLITFGNVTGKMSTASSSRFDAANGLSLILVGASARIGGAYLAALTESGGIAHGVACRSDVSEHYGTEAFVSPFDRIGSGVLMNVATTRRVIMSAISATQQIAEVPNHAPTAASIATVASGNNVLTIGTFFVTSTVCTQPIPIRAAIVLPAAYTTAQRDAIAAWASGPAHRAVLA